MMVTTLDALLPIPVPAGWPDAADRRNEESRQRPMVQKPLVAQPARGPKSRVTEPLMKHVVLHPFCRWPRS